MSGRDGLHDHPPLPKLRYVPIEIPAAAVRQMTGRCSYHQCGLELVPHADFGLDTPLDAWQCPGYGTDPDIADLTRRRKELDKADPGPWERRTEETRAEIGRLNTQQMAVSERCRDSWTVTAPFSSSC